MYSLSTTEGVPSTARRAFSNPTDPHSGLGGYHDGFCGGLTKSGGYDTVLVVVDHLTKFAHFIGLKHPFNASSVAAVFVHEVVRLHRFPSSIISDRDKIFMSHFWSELFRLQALETYLRCFINRQPKQWAKWLHWGEYCYNTAPHMSINDSFQGSLRSFSSFINTLGQ